MKLFKFKPITNGLRHQIVIQKKLLGKNNRLLKYSLLGFKSNSGHSTITGQITVRHKGGGVKRIYRKLQFINRRYVSIMLATIYDPNRSSFLFILYNLKYNTFSYTSATKGVRAGSFIICKSKIQKLQLGYRLRLKKLPIGTHINNITLKANCLSSTYIKSAGCYGQILQKSPGFCKIKFPSGFLKIVSLSSFVTIGNVSNNLHRKIVFGKAGKKRLLGVRPSVRGIAMNPVDHPHGGRTNGGRPSVTPWGKPTKGKPTVKNKKA